jgi:hypothetical protein
MPKKTRREKTISGKPKQSNIKPRIKVSIHQLDWLEKLSIFLSLWLLIYPHPYEVIFSIVLLLPILGLIINGTGKPSISSLVSISPGKSNAEYDLADFLEIPGWAILGRVLIDFEFESFFSILKVGSIFLLLAICLLLTTHRLIDKTDPHKWLIYLAVFGNIAVYSYGATYGINCVYDNSDPTVYQSRIVDKHLSRGKTTTYYFKVQPWGNHLDPENISVSKSNYESKAIGETVQIDYKTGLLGIHWYYVEK